MVRREYDFKVIGNNLKKLRLKNHLTTEDVRAYMQLGTVQAVYKWERGDCLPQADSLLALMELYGVNRIDMITGVGAKLAPVSLLRKLAAWMEWHVLEQRSGCGLRLPEVD